MTKTQIKIPKGWRKLRNGEKLRESDKGWFAERGMFSYTQLPGDCVGKPWLDMVPYIRRIPRRSKQGRKKK